MSDVITDQDYYLVQHLAGRGYVVSNELRGEEARPPEDLLPIEEGGCGCGEWFTSGSEARRHALRLGAKHGVGVAYKGPLWGYA